MDIESWIHTRFDYIVPYGGGTDLRVDCPFCPAGDSSQHLHISLVKPTYHCFKCDAKGTWAQLVSHIDGVDISEVMTDDGITPLYLLLERHQLRQTRLVQNAYNIMGWTEMFVTVNDGLEHDSVMVQHFAAMAAQYIEHRMSGIKYLPQDRVLNRYGDMWGVWAAPSMAGRLVMPVEDGWWTSRRMLRYMEPKYLSCTRPIQGRLYNAIVLDTYEEVCVAEGIISAEYVGPNCVALCGKKATPEQAKRLAAATVERYELCLDAGTLDETLDLAEVLSRAGKEVYVRIYDHGDPASASKGYRLERYSIQTRLALRWGISLREEGRRFSSVGGEPGGGG